MITNLLTRTTNQLIVHIHAYKIRLRIFHAHPANKFPLAHTKLYMDWMVVAKHFRPASFIFPWIQHNKILLLLQILPDSFSAA
ncbi:hypothetical protein D3C73_1224470 [compost metagenome]